MVKWAPENEQSEFNQGIATLMRIHSCLLELGEARSNTNYIKQYRFLDVLYQEVNPVLNEARRTKALELKEKADKSFDALMSALNSKQKSIKRGILKDFDNFEMFLRDQIQSHSLGLPQKKDPRYALANK